jgi:hypothetical protein
MQTIYHYFIDGDIFQTTFDATNPDFPPAKLAWSCPVCGEVWGRAVTSHEARWVFITAPCKKHRWFADVPGSLIPREPTKKKHSPMFWARVVEHLPDELLRRELALTLKYFEGILNDDSNNSKPSSAT